jgi:hypothetical protein
MLKQFYFFTVGRKLIRNLSTKWSTASLQQCSYCVLLELNAVYEFSSTTAFYAPWLSHVGLCDKCHLWVGWAGDVFRWTLLCICWNRLPRFEVCMSKIRYGLNTGFVQGCGFTWEVVECFWLNIPFRYDIIIFSVHYWSCRSECPQCLYFIRQQFVLTSAVRQTDIPRITRPLGYNYNPRSKCCVHKRIGCPYVFKKNRSHT